jgi:hypothetical protein
MLYQFAVASCRAARRAFAIKSVGTQARRDLAVRINRHLSIELATWEREITQEPAISLWAV